MSSFTSKLGDKFLHVPKLSADSRNWVIYRDRLQLSAQARRLDGHLDGTDARPLDPPTQEPAEKPFETLTEDEQKVIKTYKAKL